MCGVQRAKILLLQIDALEGDSNILAYRHKNTHFLRRTGLFKNVDIKKA